VWRARENLRWVEEEYKWRKRIGMEIGESRNRRKGGRRGGEEERSWRAKTKTISYSFVSCNWLP